MKVREVPMLQSDWESKIPAKRERGPRRGLLAVHYAMFVCLAMVVVLSLIVAFAPYLP
jgi:hypothetical protein